MDLAILCGIRRGEPGGESRGEVLPYGLESATEGCRAERPLEAATTIELAPAASPIEFVQAVAYLLSIVGDVGGWWWEWSGDGREVRAFSCETLGSFAESTGH